MINLKYISYKIRDNYGTNGNFIYVFAYCFLYTNYFNTNITYGFFINKCFICCARDKF